MHPLNVFESAGYQFMLLISEPLQKAQRERH